MFMFEEAVPHRFKDAIKLEQQAKRPQHEGDASFFFEMFLPDKKLFFAATVVSDSGRLTLFGGTVISMED